MSQEPHIRPGYRLMREAMLEHAGLVMARGTHFHTKLVYLSMKTKGILRVKDLGYVCAVEVCGEIYDSWDPKPKPLDALIAALESAERGHPWIQAVGRGTRQPVASDPYPDPP